MEDQQPIEELFRESLLHHEEPVNPELWDRISRQLQSPVAESFPKTDPASTTVNISGGLGGSALQWIAAAVITLSAGTGAYFYLANRADEPRQNSQPLISEEIIPEIAPETVTPYTGDASSEENYRDITGTISGDGQIAGEKPDAKGLEIITNSQSAIRPPEISSSDKGNTPAQESVTHTGQGTTATEMNSSVPVVEAPNPVASGQLTAFPETGTAPLKVTFRYRGNADKLQWDFGDGVTLNMLSQADHTFSEPGEYTITLKGINHQQKQVSETVTVRVLSDLTIRGLPNVLTPNYDGLNDVFSFNSTQFTDIEVNIYDQAGNLVYRFRDTESGWDGKLSNGKEAGEGTYIYIIFARSHDQRQHQQKGLLRLIR